MEWTEAVSKLSLDSLARVESVWKVKLPTDLAQCLLDNNGGRPSKVLLTVHGNMRVLSRLFCFNEDPDLYVLDYWDEDMFPSGIYPFASDVFGNMICLDYRGDQSNPCIVFWDHEMAHEDPELAITTLARSFTEFLSLLRPWEDKSE